MPTRRPATSLWTFAALGLAGSLLVTIAAPRAIEDPVVGWWYPLIRTGRGPATLLVWLGMVLLAIAWLAIALGVGDRGPGPRSLTVRRAIAVAALWALPLLLAPPIFSRDVYSYLAQGMILHLGRDPYAQSPSILAGLGHPHLLAAVSKFWRHTTAPYGPLFLEVMSWIAAACGRHLAAAVLLSRLLVVAGLALLAVHVPRIARALGADEGRAAWLALASPLVLLGDVIPAHNDLLMAGLLAAGVAYALRGNPLLGIGVCALAGTIKLPALVGAVFIAVCWARTEQGTGRLRLLAASGAIVVAVLALVTLATGSGLGWLSSSVFSTPAKVRLAITPATAVGETATLILHGLGVGIDGKSLEAALGVVATGIAACLGLWLLVRVRIPQLAAILGLTLLLAAIGGPAAWPWYLLWGLVLLCACPRPQRSWAMLAVPVIGPFLVRPDGILQLPLTAAPAVLAVYLALAAVALARARRGPGSPGAAGSDGARRPEPDALSSTLIST